jgi:hypothetical protein
VAQGLCGVVHVTDSSADFVLRPLGTTSPSIAPIRYGVYPTIACGCTTQPFSVLFGRLIPMPDLLPNIPTMGWWESSKLPPSERRATLIQDQNKGFEVGRSTKRHWIATGYFRSSFVAGYAFDLPGTEG